MAFLELEDEIKLVWSAEDGFVACCEDIAGLEMKPGITMCCFESAEIAEAPYPRHRLDHRQASERENTTPRPFKELRTTLIWSERKE